MIPFKIAMIKITENSPSIPLFSTCPSGVIKNININDSNKTQPKNVSKPTKANAFTILSDFCFPKPAKDPEKIIKTSKT